MTRPMIDPQLALDRRGSASEIDPQLAGTPTAAIPPRPIKKLDAAPTLADKWIATTVTMPPSSYPSARVRHDDRYNGIRYDRRHNEHDRRGTKVGTVVEPSSYPSARVRCDDRYNGIRYDDRYDVRDWRGTKVGPKADAESNR